MAVIAPTGRDRRPPVIVRPWTAASPEFLSAPAGSVSARRVPDSGQGEGRPAATVQNARDLLVAAALCALIALLCWPA